MTFYDSMTRVLGLGLEAKDLTFVSIALRGVIVFIVALVMVRLADRRFLANLSAFDAILTFILASMLARAINGSCAFFQTLGGGFVLVGMHRLLSALSFRWPAIGALTKGRAVILVENGKLKRQNLAATKISEDDLLEEARINGQVGDVAHIAKATMERNGQVSVLQRNEK
jgi:uncharacterized membrane protein YcaP (DUF421 family)